MVDEQGIEQPGSLEPDPDMLVEIARMRMPFGRYAGTRLIDLPEPYVVWFRERGYPRGRLGELLATVYEIKANGLEGLLAPLREPDDPRHHEAPASWEGRRRGSTTNDPRPRSRRR